jgi:acyl-CoA synthetase (AMP-forming)/AMP-acid ligase II
MPLTDLLRDHGDRDSSVLIFQETILTRQRLLADIERASEALRRAGLAGGDKVLLTLPNGPEQLIALFALSDCGAVVMPMNPALGVEERTRIEALARPDFIVGSRDGQKVYSGVYVSRSSEAIDDHDGLEDVAMIIFTSGTTGVPKGVMLTEAGILANAESVATYLDLSDRDRSLVFLPLSYGYALSQVLSTLTAGGTVVLLQSLRYPKEAFQAMSRHAVTGLGGVPTSLAILARHQKSAPADLPRLRYILSAGGPLAPTLLDEIQGAFSGVTVFNNYGCTEIGPRATAFDCSAFPGKLGSIGRAIPGVNLTLVASGSPVQVPGEIGEIVLSGPSLMKGYYRDPQTTASRMSRFGFHTGDYASFDGDGFLYYLGREDDIFKSAGEKVSAKEVEDVVMAHQDVTEAAVIAHPDALLGAVPVVYAVLRPGSVCTDRDLQSFCARRLARHKVPRAVHFVEALRKTETGKIQKHWLRHTSPLAPTAQ